MYLFLAPNGRGIPVFGRSYFLNLNLVHKRVLISVGKCAGEKAHPLSRRPVYDIYLYITLFTAECTFECRHCRSDDNQ